MADVTQIGLLGPEERVELGTAGLRTFFRIADTWGLSVADQQILLGDIGRTTHHQWRQQAPNTAESYTTDRLTRLSLLLGIHGLVQRLYGETPAYANAWLAAPNQGAAFRGQSPLGLIREQGLPGLQFVRRILEADAGGGLDDADALAWDGGPLGGALAATTGAR